MLKIGDPAPDFTLTNTENKPVSLSQLRGQNVVLVFYPLAFSPICTGELKSLTGNAAKYTEKKATVLGVSVDSRYCQAEFKKKESLAVELLADFHPKGEVARKYGVWMEDKGFAKRGTFVIDKQGILRGITIHEPANARSEEEYFAALASCPL